MASTISFSKSLRTNKVSPDPGNVAESFRYWISNPTAEIPQYLIEQYGRPAAIDAGLPFLSPGCPGCFSPLYRIVNENVVDRPQYSEYLNVPQGLLMTANEYQNRPHQDAMGNYRDRAWMLDGVYQRMKYPRKQEDPSSDKDWLAQQQWFANQIDTKYDNRLWLNSSETQSGF